MKLPERKPKLIGENKAPKKVYPAINYRASHLHVNFVNGIIFDNTEKHSKKTKAQIFCEQFIESHPDFAKFKKAKIKNNELEIE